VFHKRRRKAGGAEPACINDDVVAGVGEAIERLSKVRPDSTEVTGASGLREARKEEPVVSTIVGERFALVQHNLAEGSAITVRFRHAEQAFASG
jgi:hypothetical protein